MYFEKRTFYFKINQLDKIPKARLRTNMGKALVLTSIHDFSSIRHRLISFNLHTNLRGRYHYNIIIANQSTFPCHTNRQMRNSCPGISVSCCNSRSGCVAQEKYTATMNTIFKASHNRLTSSQQL